MSCVVLKILRIKQSLSFQSFFLNHKIIFFDSSLRAHWLEAPVMESATPFMASRSLLLPRSVPISRSPAPEIARNGVHSCPSTSSSASLKCHRKSSRILLPYCAVSDLQPSKTSPELGLLLEVEGFVCFHLFVFGFIFVSWLMRFCYVWRPSEMCKIWSLLLVGLMFWWKVWNLIGDTVAVIIDFAEVSGSVVELEFSGYWYKLKQDGFDWFLAFLNLLQLIWLDCEFISLTSLWVYTVPVFVSLNLRKGFGIWNCEC